MSERTFTITLTEQERLSVLYSLGHLWGALKALPDITDPISSLVYRLTNAQASGSGTDAAKAILSPPTTVHQPPAAVELKDRWQRSKKGVEVPFPEGCETIEADLWKVEPNPTRQNQPRWKITWAAPNGGQGFVDGSCFDEKLFPYLANRVKQKTVLHVVKNGKYLNVVGVRA